LRDDGVPQAILKVSRAWPDEEDVQRSLLPENPSNGGFPEPPPSMSVRIVAARHDECGHSTRVRLPSSVPARAVHRLRCDHCERSFEIGEVDDFGLESELNDLEAAVPAKRKRRSLALPKLSKPKLSKPKVSTPKVSKPKVSKPNVSKSKVSKSKVKLAKTKPAKPAGAKSKLSLPTLSLPKLAKPSAAKSKSAKPKTISESRGWRLATIPVAAALVIGGLFVIQGGGDDSSSPAAPDKSPPSVENGDNINSIPPATAGDPTGAPASPSDAAAAGAGAGAAQLVSGSTYSLALPKGWERTEPPAGATFSAAAPNGEADATLWITRDPKLDFPTFVSQSLTQLEALAGSANIVQRVPAPTEEGTIVRLAADAPAGQPTYSVTLRVAGPYRYYLATTVQPDASSDATQAADLVAGSFTPEAKG
jgi:hypothetical protein